MLDILKYFQYVKNSNMKNIEGVDTNKLTKSNVDDLYNPSAIEEGLFIQKDLSSDLNSIVPTINNKEGINNNENIINKYVKKKDKKQQNYINKKLCNIQKNNNNQINKKTNIYTEEKSIYKPSKRPIRKMYKLCNNVNKTTCRKSKYQFKRYQSTNTSKNSLDPTELYLKEVSKTPLLTKEEEVMFAKMAKKGDQSAFEKMIKSNLRLVIRIARKYIQSGMPILDLIEEGNLGLIKAVEKFDPDKGFRFSTYGAFWIQQNIENAIMTQNRTIKIPVHVAKKLYSCLKKSREISKNLSRKPSSKELARNLNYAHKEIEAMMILNEKIVSLDTPVSDEINKPILDTLGNESSNPINEILHKNLQSTINDWLDNLSPNQKQVIQRRFGLNEHEPTTLEKTGEEVGLTRERVRQLQNDALKILKKNILKDGENSNNLLN